MADEMHSKQHKFRGFSEFPGLSCILIGSAKEMAMRNNKLAPKTGLRSVKFFSNARNFAGTSDLLEKQ